MSDVCRDCGGGREIQHCHGTLVRHLLWHSECTDPDCTVPEIVAHTFVIDCEVVGCECAQPMGSAEVFAS